MAELPKVVRIGDTLTNLIDKNTNQTITYTKVNNWWDGTPMTAVKADGEIYRRKGVEYFLKNLGKYGELFLEKDTMQEMRDLSSTEILLLQMGYYKGVRLNGYHSKGDTPAPIEYVLSSTNISDNGGSVIEVGGVKLANLFESGVINAKYFGVVGDGIVNDSPSLQRCIDFARSCTIKIPKGVYILRNRITFPQNWQVLFEGEGKLSRRGGNFTSGDGIVKFVWDGDPSEESAFYYEGDITFEGELKNFYLSNLTGSKDIDGITFNANYTVGSIEGISINGFRNGLVLRRWFFYTHFFNCMFSNNIIGILAENPTGEALSNGALFEKCIINLNEQAGFYGRRLGEIINFKDCYMEQNGQYALDIQRCKVINVEGGYIEFNGENEEFPETQRGTFRVGTSGGGSFNSMQTVFNANGNFIFERGDSHNIITLIAAEQKEITVNFLNNMFSFSQLSNSTFVRLPSVNTAPLVSFNLQGSGYFDSSFEREDIRFSNGNASSYMNVTVSSDPFTLKAFPELIGRGLHSELIYPNLLSSDGNFDRTAVKSIDFPSLVNSQARLDIFANTNTTGGRLVRLYRGDGTSNIAITLNAENGSIDAERYKFAGVNRYLESGGANPEGSVATGIGSMYLRTSEGNERPYYKTASGDIGWQPIAFLSDIPEEIILDPVSDITTPDATDEATAIALANDNKAKINELLAELRSKGLMNI